MSDQCAVNGVFNAGVKKIRKDLLPSVIKEFDSLSHEERYHIAEVGTYACRLHLLANLHTPAEKGLQQYEDCTVEGVNPHSLHHDEIGSMRFIRTCCSAFTKRGSQSAGAPVLVRNLSQGARTKELYLSQPQIQHQFCQCCCSLLPSVRLGRLPSTTPK